MPRDLRAAFLFYEIKNLRIKIIYENNIFYVEKFYLYDINHRSAFPDFTDRQNRQCRRALNMHKKLKYVRYGFRCLLKNCAKNVKKSGFTGCSSINSMKFYDFKPLQTMDKIRKKFKKAIDTYSRR